MERRHLFTSESVTEGHPDKVCDQISDAIVDAFLAEDPEARVAAETVVTTGLAVIVGEVTSRATVDVTRLARQVIRDIGYTDPAYGFDADTCAVLTALHGQSPDIARGVDLALEARASLEAAAAGGAVGGAAAATGGAMEAGNGDPGDGALGAGDQGMMVGFACRETPELMPLPIALAHRLARRLAAVRKSGELPFLRPDGKTQVTVEYEEAIPVRLHTVVVSTQHDPDVSQARLREAVRESVVRPVVGEMLDGDTRLLVNPTGRFVIGGPHGDSGLTGRKIIVDTYGGYARHGGGAFSGKDPTKVDRSGAYAARWVAKNVVAAGLADRCEVQVAYAIGVAAPVSLRVDTFGTGRLPDGRIAELVSRHFDLRPAAIIRQLGLRRPLYRAVAAYGHFGRPDLDLPWERTDLAETLARAAAAPLAAPR